MKREGNSNAAETGIAVNKLVTETFDKIIEGAKTSSDAIGNSSDPIGNVAAGGAGAAAGAVGTDVDKLVKGIKSIVDIVLEDEGKHDAGTDKKADGLTVRTAVAAEGEAGKLFANAAGDANNAKKVAADASKAVGAVTGADILQAMIKDNGDAAKLAKETTGTAIAVPKDGTIAGGIALRAMAKGGKFANDSTAANNDVTAAVKGAAVSAVIKALDTLTIAIRKTIDAGLKTVKDAMKINADDTPISPEQNIPKIIADN
ncbi:Variable outer membrane protein (plasmid) [Borrelia hermsii MTW]|uniref:Variable large protein n=1 Tax=Borrelia hermsii MTW TaxID=1313291 RepID=W5T545_BORHE|nr:Variable outer membrane protein [Borrelia hermsii MTW]